MKKKIKTSVIIVILIVIGIASLFFIRALRNREPQVAEENNLGVPVETAAVKKDDFEIIFKHSGTVKYLNRTKISPQIGGEITEIYVEEGDQVEAGQILAKIDDQELKNNLDSVQSAVEEAEINFEKVKLAKIVAENNLLESKAALREAQSDWQQWQNDYERDKKLYQADAIAEAKFEQTKTQYQKAQARLERMRSSVSSAEKAVEMAELDIESAEKKLRKSRNEQKNAEIKLKDSEIKAPTASRLINSYLEVGENVGTAQVVFETAQTNAVEIRVELGMKELRQVNPGTKAVIYYGQNDKNIIESEISEIDQTADPISRTTEVTIPVTNENNEFRDGDFAAVEITAESVKEALIVQNKAIFNFKGEPHVYLIRDGKAARIKIETGLSDGYFTVVKDGLNEGDQIAVTNINDLQNDTAVYLSRRENGDD